MPLLTFRTLYWKAYEVENNPVEIFTSGLTENNETVFAKIINFRPHVYIQLPTNRKIDWRDKYLNLYEHICKSMHNNKPVQCEYVTSMKMLCQQVPVQALKLYFNNDRATRFVSYMLGRNMYIPCVGLFEPNEFLIHENNIETLIKFFTAANICPTDWIQVNGKLENFSHCQYSIVVDWKDVAYKEMPLYIKPDPYIASFDIETYSENHNSKMPDPKNDANEIIQIAVTFTRKREEQYYERYLLSQNKCPDINNCIVMNFKSERNLIVGFIRLLQNKDPDILVGYNIIKFDWLYIIERAEKLGIVDVVKSYSRLKELESPIIVEDWFSKAKGDQNFQYLSPYGVLNIDILIDVQDNFKLAMYNLDFVSRELLGDAKEDVTYKQLFKIWRILTLVNNKTAANEIKTLVNRELRNEKNTVIKSLVRTINESTQDNIYSNMLLLLKRIGEYNIQDTILPLKIMYQYNILESLEASSNIFRVPVDFLQIRGQQIKVISQLYHRINSKYIFNLYKKSDEYSKYKGAIVIDGKPGLYKNVGVMDFMSLYPTIIISENIDYTTYVTDPSIPDSDCNISEWEEHQNCEHDTTHVKELNRRNDNDQAKYDKEEARLQSLRDKLASATNDIVRANTQAALDELTTKINESRERRANIQTNYNKKSGEKRICAHHRYRFLKRDVNGPGVLPSLLENLLTRRKEVKREIYKYSIALKDYVKQLINDTCTNDTEYLKSLISKPSSVTPSELNKISNEVEKHESLYTSKFKEYRVILTALDKKQLAIKISANSMYGIMGASQGYLPLLEGAMTVTAKGRQHIMNTIKIIQDKYSNAELVYGDTDSCMFIFKGETIERSFDLCEEASKLVTSMLPKPMELEFETMYSKYMFIRKKLYIAISSNRHGEVIGITNKGVITKRRDSFEFLRHVYNTVVDMVFNERSYNDIIYFIYDEVRRMFSGVVPDEHFLIHVGIKDHEKYANQNILQVSLANKLVSRGESVPANSRLEYVILRSTKKNARKGEKVEDFTYYKENKQDLGKKIDYADYFENRLIKTLNKVLNIKRRYDIERLGVKLGVHTQDLYQLSARNIYRLLNTDSTELNCELKELKLIRYKGKDISIADYLIQKAKSTDSDMRRSKLVTKLRLTRDYDLFDHNLLQELLNNHRAYEQVVNHIKRDTYAVIWGKNAVTTTKPKPKPTIELAEGVDAEMVKLVPKFISLNITQLREYCKQRNINIKGITRKNDIITTIIKYESKNTQHNNDTQCDDDTRHNNNTQCDEVIDITNMTVPQLRALAKRHNVKIPSKCRKQEIIELLTQNN